MSWVNASCKLQKTSDLVTYPKCTPLSFSLGTEVAASSLSIFPFFQPVSSQFLLPSSCEDKSKIHVRVYRDLLSTEILISFKEKNLKTNELVIWFFCIPSQTNQKKRFSPPSNFCKRGHHILRKRVILFSISTIWMQKSTEFVA